MFDKISKHAQPFLDLLVAAVAASGFKVDVLGLPPDDADQQTAFFFLKDGVSLEISGELHDEASDPVLELGYNSHFKYVRIGDFDVDGARVSLHGPDNVTIAVRWMLEYAANAVTAPVPAA